MSRMAQTPHPTSGMLFGSRDGWRQGHDSLFPSRWSRPDMTVFPRLLTRPEVEEVVGLSCATVYRLMASGDFPRPIRLGGRAVRWKSDDLLVWIESRPSTTAKETPAAS